jgi:type VI secretion system protein ImpH
MAGQDGAPPHPLIAALQADPTGFDFFRAARGIECAYPDAPGIGRAWRAGDEPIRFGQVASLAFAPSTLAAPDGKGRGGDRPRILVHFLGLLGPNGPLPLHITEYIRDRERNGDDPTLASFLDIFHHRAISLFYRAWAGAQQAVCHQRVDAARLLETDRFALYVGSLCGLGMPSLAARDAVPDSAKLYYAGHLSCQSHHAEGLAGIISGYFGIPAAVEEFIGQWLELDADRRLLLGKTRATGTLGSTAIVGGRIWDRQQTFRLRLGPMDFEAYQRLLPGGAGLKRLVGWVKNYVGDELRFEARLVLKADSVPQTRLGRVGRLGWSTWMSSKKPARDAEDLVLKPAV